jgi:hypothetical protein
MSNRVQKSSSKKTRERATLAAYIEETGREIMPCSNCYRRKKVCRMVGSSSRCGECVNLGRSCDGVDVSSACLSYPILCVFLVLKWS